MGIPAYEITACILLVWAVVFLGGQLKVLFFPAEYGHHIVLYLMVYTFSFLASVYGAIGLIRQKMYGVVFGHIILLSVIFCAVMNVLIPSLLVVPSLTLGALGVLLLSGEGVRKTKKTKGLYENIGYNEKHS